MPKPDSYDLSTKHMLIYAHQRVDQMSPPYYRLLKPDFDRVPDRSYLIEAETGTEGRLLTTARVVVQLNDPGRIPLMKRTAGGRTVLKFWSNGMAVRSLVDVRAHAFRHVVFPGEPGYAKLRAFDMACEIRRKLANRPRSTGPKLLYEALGLDIREAAAMQDLCRGVGGNLRPYLDNVSQKSIV